MKKSSFKTKAGLNFKKMVRKLSNNALKYLISVSNQEASYRNLKISIPNLGEDLPIIELFGERVVLIRDQEWKIKAYTLDSEDWVILDAGMAVVINPEEENWFEKYKEKKPIAIKLTSHDTADEKVIEFHSRSKIFWFAKLLEPKEEVDDSFESDLKWD